MKKVLFKIIDFLVNKRIYFTIFFVSLMLLSIYLFTKVNVNNDISSYLDPNSDTSISFSVMEDNFVATNSFNLMIEDIDKDEAARFPEKLTELDGIESVIYQEKTSYKDGYALYNVFLKYDSMSEEAKKCVEDTKELCKGYKIYLSGGVVEMQFLGNSVNSTMITILLWSSLVVTIIIILNSKSWIEPVIFVIVIATAIIINIGTNVIFPSVSFVTQSICAVMQLALAMDYSIMFLHRYMQNREKDKEEEASSVVKKTLSGVFLPISGSALTTIAGLLALVTMRFKLGLDIGLVLAKGIFISLIVTFFFMPGIIVLFSKLIERTKHRNLYTVVLDKFPKIKTKVNNFQFKTRFAIPITVLIIIAIGSIFNFKSNFTYALEASSDPQSELNRNINKITDVFGIRNSVGVLIPKGDSEFDTEREIVTYLKGYTYNEKKVFNDIQAISEAHYYDELTYAELSEYLDIPEKLVEIVYLDINPNSSKNTKLAFKDVVAHITDTDFLDRNISKANDIIDSLDTILQKLDNTLDPESLSTDVNELLHQGLYNTKQMTNLFNSIYDEYTNHTLKELIIYLVSSNYFYNIYH